MAKLFDASQYRAGRFFQGATDVAGFAKLHRYFTAIPMSGAL